MAIERVQKILANLGYGSRRNCEELISAGRVKVNGKIISLGDKADSEVDRVELDGKAVKDRAEKVYIALYKPRKYLSVIDENDDRPNVRDIIGIKQHVFPIGRLDFDSEGLIILTNDGDLANKMTHPRYGHEKEYHVEVKGRPDDEQLAIWRRGVVLEDGYRTQPAQVEVTRSTNDTSWLTIIMKEGRKRQIREIGGRLGLPVYRIKRVRIGTIKLGNMKAGDWRHLTKQEVAGLTGKKTAP
jgi:23S rRNA pseudouridine2605 synthase